MYSSIQFYMYYSLFSFPLFFLSADGLRLHPFLKILHMLSVLRGFVFLQERIGYYIALLPSIGIKSSKPMAINIILYAAAHLCLNLTSEILTCQKTFFLVKGLYFAIVYFSVLVLSQITSCCQWWSWLCFEERF